MDSHPSSGEVPTTRLLWRHYALAALFAYALPWLAIIVEMFFTWGTQMHLAGHFGIPLFSDPYSWLWMMIPGAITFVILLPFIRLPRQRWIASACVLLGWTLFLLSIQTNTK